jgi:hypothetical protein
MRQQLRPGFRMRRSVAAAVRAGLWGRIGSARPFLALV